MAEEDPVADFLARERNDLAGVLDENDMQAPAAPAPDANEADPFAASAVNPPSRDGAPVEDDFFAGANDQAAAGAGGNDFELIPQENQNGDVSPTPPEGAGGGELMNGAAGDAPRGPSPVVPRVEPEKIRRWREEQKVRLEEKDQKEEQEKKEWKSKAKKELEDWYKTRSENLEKNKKQNRLLENEQATKAEKQKGPGREWERITELCEFNPKHAKTTQDVSRFKTLLLQLKQTKVDE